MELHHKIKKLLVKTSQLNLYLYMSDNLEKNRVMEELEKIREIIFEIEKETENLQESLKNNRNRD